MPWSQLSWHKTHKRHKSKGHFTSLEVCCYGIDLGRRIVKFNQSENSISRILTNESAPIWYLNWPGPVRQQGRWWDLSGERRCIWCWWRPGGPAGQAGTSPAPSGGVSQTETGGGGSSKVAATWPPPVTGEDLMGSDISSSSSSSSHHPSNQHIITNH